MAATLFAWVVGSAAASSTMFWARTNRHAGYVLKGAAVMAVVLFAWVIGSAVASSPAQLQIGAVTLAVLFVAWFIGRSL